MSNWAIPDAHCRHNLSFWKGGDYRGFGCAAHSRAGERRWWNLRTPERYIEAVSQGRDPMAAEEFLDPTQRCLEALMGAIRTREGIPWDPGRPVPARLSELVVQEAGRLHLNLGGRLLANEVTEELSGALCG